MKRTGSIIAFVASYISRFNPMITPAGMPVTQANPNPTSTRRTLATEWSRSVIPSISPIVAILTNALTTSTGLGKNGERTISVAPCHTISVMAINAVPRTISRSTGKSFKLSSPIVFILSLPLLSRAYYRSFHSRISLHQARLQHSLCPVL